MTFGVMPVLSLGQTAAQTGVWLARYFRQLSRPPAAHGLRGLGCPSDLSPHPHGVGFDQRPADAGRPMLGIGITWVVIAVRRVSTSC